MQRSATSGLFAKSLNVEEEKNMDAPGVGTALLRRPLVPLTFLVSHLFLTTSLRSVEDAVSKIKDNIALEGVVYRNPRSILNDYLDVLEPYEKLKRGELKTGQRLVVDRDMKPLDPLAGIILEIKQEMVRRELSRINSALCAEHHCIICCCGPIEGEENLYFELPLADEELRVFDLPRIDLPPTRATNASTEPPCLVDGQAFYAGPPALYRWREGWSLILSRGSLCPNLNVDTGRCLAYSERPEVCRLPQIFPVVLEKVFDPAAVARLTAANNLPMERLSDKDHYFVAQEKILAVWDCPYVQAHKKDIVRFAELSSLEPVFRKNKK